MYHMAKTALLSESYLVLFVLVYFFVVVLSFLVVHLAAAWFSAMLVFSLLSALCYVVYVFW